MRSFRGFIVTLLCFLMVIPMISNAQEDDVSRLLEISEEDQYLVYGEYAEIEVTATEDVTVEFENEVLPFGMELESV